MNQATAIIIGATGTEKKSQRLEQLDAVFDNYRWYYSTLDVSVIKPAEVRTLTQAIKICKLLVIDETIGFDAGMLAGYALEKVPLLVYSSSDSKHSPIIGLSDGICFGIDDLTLFMDTFLDRKYMSEIRSRIMSALTTVKNARTGF